MSFRSQPLDQPCVEGEVIEWIVSTGAVPQEMANLVEVIGRNAAEKSAPPSSLRRNQTVGRRFIGERCGGL